MQKILCVQVVMVACVALVGCASRDNRNSDDPLESFNRTVSSFNDGLDRATLKPVATGYKKVTPDFVSKGFNNVVSNIGGVWSTANAGLQLKGKKFLTGSSRFGVNTVLGLGGLFDIASKMGLNDPQEDLGQTLGYWGVPSGPYVVLPLLGPSTVRDTVGTAVDMAANPFGYINNESLKLGVAIFDSVDMRAQMLDGESVLENPSDDHYTLTREGYLQGRESLIHDNKPLATSFSDAKDRELY